ncbi:Transcription elongation factor SPT6 [Frankliniella fusca]|uniref:Transcription elongation factor SPT6 n=1 Tax=Frankliniella fusca TaxID=407009 RepID=A0AAE1HHW4_9NEOP|nr:Transcription elongation factor SPT6 [Frankliniella fusca]
MNNTNRAARCICKLCSHTLLTPIDEIPDPPLVKNPEP